MGKDRVYGGLSLGGNLPHDYKKGRRGNDGKRSQDGNALHISSSYKQVRKTETSCMAVQPEEAAKNQKAAAGKTEIFLQSEIVWRYHFHSFNNPANPYS